MNNIGILSSGGDASGMNAAIRSVVRLGVFNELRVYGIMEGYRGLMNGDFVHMDVSSVGDIIHRGGTILKTSRADEFKTDEGKKNALKMLEKYKIDSLVVIGGDGSMRGAYELKKLGVNTFVIPATIDNDMGYTDYTIGFMTAIENVADCISKIRDTSGSHGRANVIEVMGRRCGDLALYSGLSGGAESFIIPEMDYDIDSICTKIIQGKSRGKRHHIIILSEGVGDAAEIAKTIQDKTGVDTRVSILGYLQRGGTPSSYDRIIAAKMGQKAIELILDGCKGAAIGIKDDTVVGMNIEDALKIEKQLDIKLYELMQELSI